MLEMLLALLLGAAPGVPFAAVPVDSLVAVVARVGNGWDPNGGQGPVNPTGSDETTNPEPRLDIGNGWDPNG